MRRACYAANRHEPRGSRALENTCFRAGFARGAGGTSNALLATKGAMTAQLLPCSESFDIRAGAVFAGKYTLMRPLGVGGMGTVWVARNEATGADVALKFLLHQTADQAPESQARMRREAWATARLSHRGIVRVYDMVDLSESGDRIALVMELLRGRTLAALLDARVKLTVDEMVAIALPLLSALAHAHAAGIIHRDLKPENVFLAVEPDGVVTPKILDFGISKMKPAPDAEPRSGNSLLITRDGEMLGTPSYMSPEQVRGKQVDARSDLFNVGILLYEMLAGRNPFGGEGVHSAVVSILEETPTPIEGITPDLWRLIARALAKDTKGRFQSAEELAVALRAAAGLPAFTSVDGSGQHVSFVPPPRPRSRPRRRGWALVASAGAAALVAAVTSASLAVWTTGVAMPTRGYAPSGAILPARTPLAANRDEPIGPGQPPPVETTAPASTNAKPAQPNAPVRRVKLARDPGF
jgi:serine/threonine-protein kinase